MKICVYTICLNENHEVAGWLTATEDADCRVVVDTGSTDGTTFGKNVMMYHAAILPWRFDDAFNTALALVPRDVDVCFRVDMDERPRPGWRQAIEAEFNGDTTMLRYPYNWSRDINFYCDRIHARKGYRWRGATHEGLHWRGDRPEHQKFINSLTVDHFQKPKNRPNDLPLLRETVTEYPQDARLRLYYGRELLWRNNAAEAIKELRMFQSLSEANCDIAYSYRLLAQADPANKLEHLKTAERLDPTASVYLDIADYWYAKDWAACYQNISLCIAKCSSIGNWTDDPRLKTSYPYDVAAIAAWHLGDFLAALTYVKQAVALDPSNTRLQDNLKMIEGKCATLSDL